MSRICVFIVELVFYVVSWMIVSKLLARDLMERSNTLANLEKLFNYVGKLIPEGGMIELNTFFQMRRPT
ncbi:MAG: hypothetical protein JSV05_00380 [Candidatus Bathyarchaeota archaeon]|nr:MAG: hypothetical protein JSV05_00380 [Candidatus Bathyarchaeota archaeon]